MASAPKLLLFVHVPKASGSTIRSIISRNYTTPGTRAAFDEWHQVDFRELAQSDSLRLIIGHFRFGMHFGLKRPVSYFSVVRNPIDRTISDYFYAYHDPAHRLREQVTSGKLTLSDFLVTTDRVALIRQLTGLEDHKLQRQEGVAEEIVAKCYSLVGISERFDETALLLAHLNDWDPPLYILKNKTKLAPEIADLRKKLRAELPADVVNHFRRDVAFYDFCVAQLDKAIALAGEGFARALTAYREIQREILKTAQARDIPEMYHQAEFRNVNKLPPFVEKILNHALYSVVAEFVKSDSPLKRRQVELVQGGIDRVERGLIEGWALKGGSAEPITVSVSAEGAPPKKVVADLDRPDLQDAGFATSKHGFKVDLGIDANNPSDVSAVVDQLHIRLAQPPMMDGRRRWNQ
jgi:hypothetical protein